MYIDHLRIKLLMQSMMHWCKGAALRILHYDLLVLKANLKCLVQFSLAVPEHSTVNILFINNIIYFKL